MTRLSDHLLLSAGMPGLAVETFCNAPDAIHLWLQHVAAAFTAFVSPCPYHQLNNSGSKVGAMMTKQVLPL